MKKSFALVLLPAVLVAVVLAVQAAPPATNKVQSAITNQEQIDKNAANSQKKIDSLSAGTQDMLNTYLETTQKTDDLRAYDDQLAQIIQSQQDQMGSLTNQTSQVGDVEKGILPLMLQMTDSLNQFVKLDIPYRQADRLAAVQQLRTQISNPSVPVTDSFQKLMQMYKDEIAAGKTVEAYRGEIAEGGKTLTVNFVRAGHLLLVYQTLDKSETGYWDKQAHKWQTADDMSSAVSQAIAVANKQAPPDLMELPVEAPEAGK